MVKDERITIRVRVNGKDGLYEQNVEVSPELIDQAINPGGVVVDFINKARKQVKLEMKKLDA